MSTDPRTTQDPKRLLLFMVLSFLLILITNIALDRLGLIPEPEAKNVAAEKGKPQGELARVELPGDKVAQDNSAKAGAESEETEAQAPSLPAIPRNRLVLGSVDPNQKSAYRLKVTLDQHGAGIWSIHSSEYNAEYLDNKPKKTPLVLIQGRGDRPLPMAIELLEQAEGTMVPFGDLEQRRWDVLIGERRYSNLSDEERDRADPVRSIKNDSGKEIAQEIAFQTEIVDSESGESILVTKTFQLDQSSNALTLQLSFLDSDGKAESEPSTLAYRLFGPYGMPIEGEWYTHTFRNAFLAKDRDGTVSVETHSALEISKAEQGEYENTQLPLAFAGIENQYFTALVEPKSDTRLDARTELVITEKAEEPSKSDVSIEIDTRPFELPSGQTVHHDYVLYAGPKTLMDLEPYGAEELANYRTIGRIPVIGFLFDFFNLILNPPVTVLSKYVIDPLLRNWYWVTATVAEWFGGIRGSYGIAILLLTITVRLGMFPLSRKQALSAKRMQELQPHMAALREKYGEDREKIAQETFALYRRYGINPLAGCLPVLIQIPIFMALWRTLNVSVSLRQAPFLWMDNLAAPDMLFGFDRLFGEGANIPLLGPYFNLLPLIVVALMFVQTKLFAPPATTPEQETQQKVMKYMMVFMALMFYRVPSGLAIYFITSSLWSVGERLLLPKITTQPALPAPGEPSKDAERGAKLEAEPSKGWLARKLEDLLEEAARERTYRRAEEKTITSRERGKDIGVSNGRDDELPGKKGRSKPGRSRSGKRK